MRSFFFDLMTISGKADELHKLLFSSNTRFSSQMAKLVLIDPPFGYGKEPWDQPEDVWTAFYFLNVRSLLLVPICTSFFQLFFDLLLCVQAEIWVSVYLLGTYMYLPFLKSFTYSVTALQEFNQRQSTPL